jgi:hypothetical protein
MAKNTSILGLRFSPVLLSHNPNEKLPGLSRRMEKVHGFVGVARKLTGFGD